MACSRTFVVFGSVLREDFHPQSDVDVLITFTFQKPNWGLSRACPNAARTDESTIGARSRSCQQTRHVERSSNWIRRQEILSTAQPIYVQIRRDTATLLDIQRASQKVIQFQQGISKTDFMEDDKTQSAIVFQLMIIGEAVKRLSQEFRTQHP